MSRLDKELSEREEHQEPGTDHEEGRAKAPREDWGRSGVTEMQSTTLTSASNREETRRSWDQAAVLRTRCFKEREGGERRTRRVRSSQRRRQAKWRWRPRRSRPKRSQEGRAAGRGGKFEAATQLLCFRLRAAAKRCQGLNGRAKSCPSGTVAADNNGETTTRRLNGARGEGTERLCRMR